MRSCWKGFRRCKNRLLAGLVSNSLLQPRCSYALRSPGRLTPQQSAKYHILPSSPYKLSPLGKRSYSTLESYGATIYALSTAPGRAAIAIIRVSGPACLDVYQALCPSKGPPKPRYATLRALYETSKAPAECELLDSGALVLYFPAPDTVTGEDILELHIHGGTAVSKAVLAAISKVQLKDLPQNIRYAEPGEFTKRAFYNNRLDLTQVEALGDTLTAETEQQRRLAVRGSTSCLAEKYEGWRQLLLYARGELEALIDFSDDQHFEETPAKLCASVVEQVQELRQQLKASIESASRGELLRNGINIALVGAPNAGKSSLLNRIVGREAAIVSEQAGTTRDIVDVSVDIGGYLCRFGDLAGLRKRYENAGHELNSIEEEGIRRARERAFKADVVIVFLSTRIASASNNNHNNTVAGLNDVCLGDEVEATLAQLDPKSQRVVCVLGKADLFPAQDSIKAICTHFSQHPSLHKFLKPSGLPIIPISCKEANSSSFGKKQSDPRGIQTFLRSLTRLFGSMTEAIRPAHEGPTGNDSSWAESLGATERQRLLLQQCLQHLDTFLAQIGSHGASEGNKAVLCGEEADSVDIVLAAENLRSAADCLAKMTGKGEAGDVEEVLGVVFEKFCVGK